MNTTSRIFLAFALAGSLAACDTAQKDEAQADAAAAQADAVEPAADAAQAAAEAARAKMDDSENPKK